ncbi:MAG TPA: SDR family NAD(P)-dependent oxidoreductase [Gemmataceae bacterium]|jgi:acyl transferase domain-containing protein/NAD(P)-dependent dehydrogenase (short-subunit alcohol dehydrogenase family)|nr:SDR family NAD(P)-dependent oxidoreductase [Gemmataceae bacterium]
MAESVPLAIVGIGCLFPKADGPGAFWANIKQGVDCVGPVPSTHWSPDDYLDADPKAPDMTYAARGAFLDAVDFNPLEFGISPVDLEATDTSQLLGLVAARQALNDAGYTADRQFDKNRVSVILGVTGTLELVIPLGARLGHPRWRKALAAAGVDKATADKVVQDIADSYVPWQENSFPGLLGNVVAGRIANKLDLGGTNCVVDAACASSLSAIHLAGLELAAGRCDVAVTGGVDTFNDIFMYMCFSKTPALSKTGDAKPFDADGDGTILGEGLGIVVLKRLADAERDGDRIYAVLKAIGSSSDGKGNAVYAPTANGQMRCLKNAYELAGVSPATIELIEAHGTGTKVGDTVEATALTQVFREAKADGTWCAVGSVKSMVGHTKAAAGAAGLIKAALALYNKVLPPTIKVKKPVDPLQPSKSPLYVNTEKRPWLDSPNHPRRAGMSAFGFGGSNFHAVLEEHNPIKAAPDWDGRVQIIALTGASPADLTRQLAEWPTATTWAELSTRAATSRADFDHSATCRLVIVADRDGNTGELISAAKAKLTADGTARSWTLRNGAYFGAGPAVGGLGVLFPGQGSQSVGMLRDLACTFPEMLASLSAAEHGWPGTKRLVDFIYPPAAFTADIRADQEKDLRATDMAQPALGAVNFGAWQVLRSFGVEADAFAGHSFGELVALCAAGVVSPADLHRLSRERGRLMAAMSGEDAGAMLAVHADLAQVETVLRREQLNLSIANRNSPSQCVLSGPTAEIARCEESLQRRRLRSTRLPVAAAFHSPLVERASVPFRAVLEETQVATRTAPVFANTTATEYPDDASAVRDLLAGQLAKPVEFVQLIENMARAGIRTFVEVGPGAVLTRLAEATLKDHADHADIDCFALDASGGKKAGLLDLANLIARIAARGHAVDLSRWEAGQSYRLPTARPGLTVPIVGANFVRPKPTRIVVEAPKSSASRGGVNMVGPKQNGESSNPIGTMPILSGTPQTMPTRTATPSSSDSSVSVANKPLRTSMNEVSTNPMSDPTVLPGALGITQQSLLAFQRMQEQTANLHRQFLENQQAALATLQALVAQQHALLTGQSIPASAITPISAPPLAATSRSVPVDEPKSKPSIPVRPIPAPPPAPLPPPPIPVAKTQATKPALLARDSSAVLLSVVAEKTGYPADMLGLDMALDADLGIDSIKRVEILSALQEKIPDAPPAKPEHLGTLHTLRDIVNFLDQSGTSTVSAASPVASEKSAASAPAPAARTADATSDVAGTLLSVVAEKTGYPADMLGLDMALDADLGIDSIKRVEILSALQERIPDAPAAKPEHLGTLHTLRDIATFLAGASPPIISPAPPSPPEAPRPFVPALILGSAEGERTSDNVPASNVPTVELPASPVEPETAPIPLPTIATVVRSIIRPIPIDLDKPRARIGLDRHAPVWLIADPSSFTARLTQQFDSVGCRPQFIPWNDSPFAYEPHGLAGLVLLAPGDSELDDLPLRAFRWLKRAAPALAESAKAGGAFFVTVTKLDGSFGFGPLDPSRDPIQGGLAGLSKTAAHEWPHIACKAIDIDPTVLRHVPHILVEEALTAGPSEVGLSAKGRVALEIVESPALLPAGEPTILSPGDVVVVTGGGRGVTAEALLPLVRASQPQLVLLGRTEVADAEPDWLVNLDDETQIKQAILAQMDKPATPRLVGAEYQRLMAQREIRQNIRRFRDAGAIVEYVSVDVQDAGVISTLMADVRRRLGPIAALVHGAGILADRRIEELSDEQFEAVYSTKVIGLQNLLTATTDDPLKAIVLFSSSTGRFGRTGQAAYAVANEVLNKIAQLLNRLRPHCRTVAINWGPWDGGMVTPSLARLFAKEGIGLIPVTEGGEVLLRELASSDRPAETVVLAQALVPATAAPTPVAPTSDLALVFERRVALADHSVLRSHVIGNKAVLPFVLHLEWMAHAALHAHPGLKFFGFDDLRIFQGIHVEESTPAQLRVLSGKSARRDGLFFVPVEIRGLRKGREVTHSRAEIVLADRLPDPPFAGPTPETGPFTQSVDEVYDYFLFHGPDLRALKRIDGMGDDGAIAFARSAPPPTEWMQSPIRGAWLADPMAMDAAFQLLSVWSYQKHRAASLPCFAAGYRQYRRIFPTEGVLIAARITRDNGTTARAAIDFIDADGRIIARLTDAEHVIDSSLNEAFRRGRIATPSVATRLTRIGS